jgi:hypothetical protein
LGDGGIEVVGVEIKNGKRCKIGLQKERNVRKGTRG